MGLQQYLGEKVVNKTNREQTESCEFQEYEVNVISIIVNIQIIPNGNTANFMKIKKEKIVNIIIRERRVDVSNWLVRLY